MIKNKFYEAPEAELLVVRFEENFLQNSPTGVNWSTKSGGAGGDDAFDDGDVF